VKSPSLPCLPIGRHTAIAIPMRGHLLWNLVVPCAEGLTVPAKLPYHFFPIYYTNTLPLPLLPMPHTPAPHTPYLTLPHILPATQDYDTVCWNATPPMPRLDLEWEFSYLPWTMLVGPYGRLTWEVGGHAQPFYRTQGPSACHAQPI